MTPTLHRNPDNNGTDAPIAVVTAQAECRAVYRHGSIGQIVAGIVWLASAAIHAWTVPPLGYAVLFVGGAMILPLTHLILRGLGGPNRLSHGNPLNGLATQIAFTVPATLPVVAGAALHRPDWAYPGAMIIVGAHYLPFTFLYGMWQFALLASALVGAGLGFAILGPAAIPVAPLAAGAVLITFGTWVAVIDAATNRTRRMPEST